jgi:hypothetical protein
MACCRSSICAGSRWPISRGRSLGRSGFNVRPHPHLLATVTYLFAGKITIGTSFGAQLFPLAHGVGAEVGAVG